MRRWEEPLRPGHVLFQYTKRVDCKVKIVEDSALNGEDHGILGVRCVEASMLHLTLSIKGIPAANAKPNKVEKDVENVYTLNIGEESSDGEQKPQRGRGGGFSDLK